MPWLLLCQDSPFSHEEAILSEFLISAEGFNSFSLVLKLLEKENSLKSFHYVKSRRNVTERRKNDLGYF